MLFRKGYNWCSLTHSAVMYLIAHKKFIFKICRATVCADECYKQYLLCNSPFAEKIFKNSEGRTDDLREIDWERRVKDSPHVYTMEDLQRLKQSPKLFARKFDEKEDAKMKIGIVTVYEPITNMGSYLQGYALKTALEKMGHKVYFIQNISPIKLACKYLCRINPKREFFLRLQKAKEFLRDVHRIKCVSRERILQEQFDLLVYGSDEIWNLDNPYFKDGLFWGLDVGDTNKIAYAVSVGAVKDSSLTTCAEYLRELPNFRSILPRDARTKEVVDRVVGGDHEIVCDPTLLLPLEDISESIQLPKNRYMLVYTYGLDEELKNTVVSYARKHNLKIVSPCFWHLWADQVIECSALQFSALIQGAECVFTTTFHGAIFTLLNHKRCCIYPVREKVKDLVVRLGEEQRLIEENCSSQCFEQIIAQPFDDEAFEARLDKWRRYSMDRLKEAISCLGK